MDRTTQNATKHHGRDMTRGSIPRHMILFSLPMLAGNLIQNAYSIVNAVWVGKGLGEVDLAAVTVSMPILFMLTPIAIGLTNGTSVLIAQFAGARNWESVRKVVQTSASLQIIVSASILVVGELMTPFIMRAMGTPSSAYPLAVSYMRIFLCGTPCVFGTFLVASMLRGIGDSKTPVYFQAGSLLLNAILDPLLIFGWFGFPKLGLNGAATASVAAQVAGLVATLVYLYRKDHLVAPDWLHLRIDRHTLGLINKIGLPTVVQQSLVSIGAAFVLSYVNAYGENATAAYGAGMRIDQIAFLPAMTLNVSVSTLVGQNIGAGRLDRVKHIFRWGIVLAGGMTSIVALVAFAFPQVVLKMFLNDPVPIGIGVGYLRCVAFAYMFFSAMFVGNGVLNGSGHTLVSTIGTLVSLWIVRVPLAGYLSHHLHRVDGVWYAILISSFVSMLISLSFYYSGIWRRSIVKHVPTDENTSGISHASDA
jgi:putative MATE family efflux protein